MAQSIDLVRSGTRLTVQKIPVEQVLNTFQNSYSLENALKHELSGIEPVGDVFVIESVSTKTYESTGKQLKDLFTEMGFHIDLFFGKKRHADFDGALNIDGFNIPGWGRLIKVLPAQVQQTLLSSYSPGKSRLHIRAYELNSTLWLIVAHTDKNWITLNLKSIYSSHVGSGAGDYIRGAELLYSLFLSKSRHNIFFNKKI